MCECKFNCIAKSQDTSHNMMLGKGRGTLSLSNSVYVPSAVVVVVTCEGLVLRVYAMHVRSLVEDSLTAEWPTCLME